MKERGILYSAPMVLAKLAGRKTQTRRVVKPQPHLVKQFPEGWAGSGAVVNMFTLLGNRYGVPGDRLWGRETFALRYADAKRDPADGVQYKADGGWVSEPRWTPSIFMPRWASRLLDEVVSVRVERLLEITEADAIAEGLEPVRSEIEQGVFGDFWRWPGGTLLFDDPRRCYFEGWDWLNGKGAAAKNPWVWAVTTRPVHDSGCTCAACCKAIRAAAEASGF